MTIKTQIRIVAAFVSLFFIPHSAFGQGSLTPPGPPGPTMLTLSQVEPRTPISSLPFTVTAPGSYYLTTNLYGPGGLTLESSSVTIDLNGFALIGNGGLYGINVTPSVTNICVRNGVIQGWVAFLMAAPLANSSRFERLQLSDSTVGAQTGSNCVVADCVFWNAGNPSNPSLTVGDGCVVRNCVLGGPSSVGIQGGNGDLVDSCVLRTNVFGIYVGTNCAIRNCKVTQCAGAAITASDGATVIDCQSQGNAGTGIVVGNNSLVEDCIVGFSSASSSYGFQGGTSVTFRHCTASNNGNDGFLGGPSCVFDGCQSLSNAAHGIRSSDNSTARSSASLWNTLNGIVLGNYSAARDCQANENTDDGIEIGNFSQIIDCQCIGNTNYGILPGTGCGVSGCVCNNNGSSGIFVLQPSCKIVNNTCNYNNSHNSASNGGIFIENSDNLVDANHVAFNTLYGIGVFSGYSKNVIIHNNAVGNSTNYFIPGGNDPGPIGNAATATSPWANISN